MALSSRKKQICDWLQVVWVHLTSEGMEEEIIKEFYSGRGNKYWNMDRGSNPWVKRIDDEAGKLRRKWRKTLIDTLEMFWESILTYYAEGASIALPAPTQLPGTPVKTPHKNGTLKQSKETIALGERLLGNRFKTLRRDIESQFAIGKTQLEDQILSAIKSSNGPVVSRMKKIEVDLGKITEKRDLVAQTQTDLANKVDAISRKSSERIDKIKADTSEKVNVLKEKSGVVEKEDWEWKEQEKVLREELGGVEDQHEEEVRAKFTEAKADLETQRQTLLRNLDLQRESEVDNLWADHLPPSIQQSLQRVPKIAQITKQLPKSIQKLLTAPQP